MKAALGFDSQTQVTLRTEGLAARLLVSREIDAIYETYEDEQLFDYKSAARCVDVEQIVPDDYGVVRSEKQAGKEAHRLLDDWWFGVHIERELFVEDTPEDKHEAGWGALPPKGSRPATTSGDSRMATRSTTSVEPSMNGPYLVRSRPMGEKCRIVRLAAAHAKAKVGLPKMTDANLQVVGRVIRDFLKEKKVRDSHINVITPLATALTFIPSRSDIEAREVLASGAALKMMDDYSAAYYSYASFEWRKPSTWFGRQYARPFSG